MRTNIAIDDDLMARAMKLSGLATKRETVETGLRLLVRLKQQTQVRRARGKLRWEGDLSEMRRDR
ncbi:MAG: transcription regulator of the Arc/MetJ class [Nitrospirae bacterium RBG_16_64_22]|nr:MAG: transcription regulator of the Arc/MetJ class [Nitrospirae bacterium RBG_16_64_22]